MCVFYYVKFRHVRTVLFEFSTKHKYTAVKKRARDLLHVFVDSEKYRRIYNFRQIYNLVFYDTIRGLQKREQMVEPTNRAAAEQANKRAKNQTLSCSYNFGSGTCVPVDLDQK